MLLGRGLCDELITRPEESYRLWSVVLCDLETSIMRRPWPTGGCRAKKKKLFWTLPLLFPVLRVALGLCAISGVRRKVDEICAVLGYYAAISGNLLQKFRDQRSGILLPKRR